MAAAIVWFRNDLRLDDNPALEAALDAGHDIIPVYVHDPDGEGNAAAGAASNAWLARSLVALDASLRERGNWLRLFVGHAGPTLAGVAAAAGATSVFWNRRYEPDVEARDAAIKRALREDGLEVESFNGSTLFEPWALKTAAGGPYRVFTPFYRSAMARWSPSACGDAPPRIPPWESGPAGVLIDQLRLVPATGWDRSFWAHWTPGEAGARAALDSFVEGALHAYAQDRDRPDRTGTSRLSPHLHFGEVAVWRVVDAVESERGRVGDAHIDAYRRQLVWRDFATQLLHHFPHTAERDLDPRFERFEWTRARRHALERWRRGRTGVPIIDAGMRELWETGWMHGRVRMIVASYLCKHMRVHWRTGAAWFRETLLDADLANNTMGWQWVAGTGADAAPYFRVFNPVTQGVRFDPRGDYVARWLPELAALPVPLRHAPWRDPTQLVRVAPGYPSTPLVDLAEGRDAALLAYRRMNDARGIHESGS
ncbi:cryptochrome/photolyase family protein [Cognatilysobacter lacus]|uniref:Deoxyribodipyrimidine photo-lyase n=1 Tax=Cognatilysobacter lacus TaxID=1643323 RepID=A0A5D8Z799_9GAMM|nr:deoxyribodipyrimidine photo-lyase [Lysobacter lacus]TZF90547.1 deoxyribodipyrimidine photo-lyase [Lysobacter lacus]